MLALVVQVWSTRKGLYTPAIMFVFWLLFLLVDIVTFRSLVLQLQLGVSIAYCSQTCSKK